MSDHEQFVRQFVRNLGSDWRDQRNLGSDRAGDSRLQFGSAQPGFGSGGGFALTVSVFITLDEAATLTDVANPLYISSASAQVSSGLMQGQLRDSP